MDLNVHRFTSKRGLKAHSTKSHQVDHDGFAVVVGGVSRTNDVTSHNSHSQLPTCFVFALSVNSHLVGNRLCHCITSRTTRYEA